MPSTTAPEVEACSLIMKHLLFALLPFKFRPPIALYLSNDGTVIAAKTRALERLAGCKNEMFSLVPFIPHGDGRFDFDC